MGEIPIALPRVRRLALRSARLTEAAGQTPHLAVPLRRRLGGHDGGGRGATGLIEKDATLAARLAELDLIVRVRKVDSNSALGSITARDLGPSEAPRLASGVLRL